MAKRFSKENWLDLGLVSLVQEGAASIRIDRLCAKAKRTKGSFYHHFKTRNAYVAALLAHWEHRLTQSVIKQADRESGAKARLMALSKITIDIDGGIERELRRWAGSDTMVQAAIAVVDKRRVDYVGSLLMQAKNISSQQAIDLATMNYASLVGFQQIFTPVNKDRRIRIEQLFADILTGLPDHDEASH